MNENKCITCNNSFQIDAPRHLFLHTVRSMSIIAKQANLEIKGIEWDSNINQFLISEKYSMGISMEEKAEFPKKTIRQFKAKTKELNKLRDGDQACFLLYKNMK